MDLYGPPLPPGYVRPEDDDSDQDTVSSKSNTPKRIIGPQCPRASPLREEHDRESIPSSKVDSNSSLIGPELPAHLRNSREQNDSISNEVCGPVLAEFEEEVDDRYERRAQIEKRAEKMKNKLDNKNLPVEVNEREEWMTVPDTSRRNQLGAISRCLAPSQSSSKDKHSHSHRHRESDKKTSEELKKYNKSRRSESLMDQHSKKLKKEKEYHQSISNKISHQNLQMATTENIQGLHWLRELETFLCHCNELIARCVNKTLLTALQKQFHSKVHDNCKQLYRRSQFN